MPYASLISEPASLCHDAKRYAELNKKVKKKISLHYLDNRFEPGHEKMCPMSYANNKGADQSAHPRSLISAFIVRCLDSIISLDSAEYSQNFKTLASFCGCVGQFVSGMVGNSRRHVLSCRGSIFITLLLRDTKGSDLPDATPIVKVMNNVYYLDNRRWVQTWFSAMLWN